MTEQSPSISALDPISPAIERVKTVLFRPFDLGRWFVIGFCAWLANMSKGGGGGPRFNFSSREHMGFESTIDQAKEFIIDNFCWLIPLVIVAVIVSIILWLLITWLSSRGRFMFLHCVVGNKAEVKIPWTKFREHANSLFLFRIALGVIGFLASVLFCMFIFVIAFFFTTKVVQNVLSVTVILLSTLVFITLLVMFILVLKFTTDFVVPIMFLRTTSCVNAWREFLVVLSRNKLRFTLYILFQIVISIAIGAIILAAVCVTCCCAACFLVIPYIGVVLMLPLFVFKRAYPLFYFQQFGPEFDFFGSAS